VSYLLDTCVLSQGAKTDRNDEGLLTWLKTTPIELQHISVLSLAEIEFGILRMPTGKRRENLHEWFESGLKASFAERLLPFDEAAASIWAFLRSNHLNAPLVDGQIAATAIAHNLTLVTRNVRDFAFAGLAVFNPWSK
jgi:predicted nucleic acid-binding protein